MKLNTILSVFSPKDTKFFPLLNETAGILNQAAIHLDELFFSTNKEKIAELCRLIKAEETKGDKVTNGIFKALNNTFITPFDREDIDALADNMDDAIDAINRAAQKVLLYSPKSLPESTQQLAGIVRKQTEEVLHSIKELSNIPKNEDNIRLRIKEVKKLEEKADIVYEEGIMELFNGDTDIVEIIKLKEVIQELEKSANRVNKVGKVIKTIIVKYA